MALIHAASITPSKQEAIAAWLPSQPWAPADIGDLELIGAYRFDDPEGEVGLETHLVRGAGEVLQVPVTYRAGPLPGADDALVCRMEHSVLGPRWVYDGLHDPAYVRMLAIVTLTGVGQAAELQLKGDEQRTRPPTVRLSGGAWITEPVRVDGWGPAEQDGNDTVLRSTDLELRLVRRPVEISSSNAAALFGTWAGQDRPALLARAAEL